MQQIASIRDKVSAAKSILIVGGGPVGIEMAGEIADAYGKSKQITLVHRGKKLLYDVFPDKARARMLDIVQSSGVRVLLDDAVELPSPSVFEPGQDAPLTTRRGQKIKADLVIVAFRFRPDTDWLPLELLEEDKSGYVKVKPTLQVNADGWDHVYALGDVAYLREVKMAARVGNHAAVLVPNLLSALGAKPPSKTYGKSINLMAITFGKVTVYSFFYGRRALTWTSLETRFAYTAFHYTRGPGDTSA